MSTITIIVLQTLAFGFSLRAAKLLELMKKSVRDWMAPKMHFNGALGCINIIYFLSFLFIIITFIFLFFKVDWWIPVIAFVLGILPSGDLVGYVIERICQLPNHQTIKDTSFDQNAFELAMDGKLYSRAAGLVIIYCLSSLVISLIILFY